MRWGLPCDGCRGPRVRGPSISTTCLSVISKTPCTQSRNPSSTPVASSRAKTRPSVLCEEIPSCSSRKMRSQASWSWPKRVMATKLPAPQMIPARTAPGCPSGCAVGFGRPADPRNVQGLDQGWGHRAVPEGVLRRLNPEPATVALGPSRLRCNRPAVLDRSTQTQFPVWTDCGRRKHLLHVPDPTDYNPPQGKRVFWPLNRTQAH